MKEQEAGYFYYQGNDQSSSLLRDYGLIASVASRRFALARCLIPAHTRVILPEVTEAQTTPLSLVDTNQSVQRT